MQAVLDLIRAEPWPFVGAGIALAVILISAITGREGDGTDFPDFGSD
jgi:hypothetical protein